MHSNSCSSYITERFAFLGLILPVPIGVRTGPVLLRTQQQRLFQNLRDLYHGKTALNFFGDIQHTSQGCPRDELDPAPHPPVGYTHALRWRSCATSHLSAAGPWAAARPQPTAPVHLDGRR